MGEYFLSLLSNLLLVTVSISAFFAPFVFIFWLRNRKQIKEVKPHFNQFAEKFFMSKESNWLIIAWAAAEALIWFILPEFLLFLMIFMKVRHKFDLLKYDIIGTVIGTIIAIFWHAPASFLTQLPFVYPKMIEQVTAWFTDRGILGIFYQPFSGVPFKVFNHLALDFNFFIPLFILLAVVARMTRYFIAYEVTKAVYPLVHKFVRKHYAILFGVALVVFTMLLMRVSQIYG
jgi:hypothetical protein